MELRRTTRKNPVKEIIIKFPILHGLGNYSSNDPTVQYSRGSEKFSLTFTLSEVEEAEQ